MFTLLRRQTPGTLEPLLEGPRVVLRPPRMDDWSAWSSLRSESRDFLTPWEPAWPRDALGQTAFRRRLRQMQRERAAAEAYGLFVTSKADGAVLGGITISDIRRGVAQTATLGYWIGQRHSRQGYMAEAIATLLPFVFVTLGLHRLEAACVPQNEPSKRLLEKSGFRQEGLARAYLKIDGQWRDHLLFAQLENEWRNRRR
jgi:[ribosomal protein S5]-alanine N-acetyltransferase